MSSSVLILTLCLSGNCRDLPVQLEIGVEGCEMTAQASIAKWLDDFPHGYTVSKWRCVHQGEREL
jgi:hypothetical protein